MANFGHLPGASAHADELNMATLVLSTVGTALGGPVGGAIGSLIGQGIDQQIFGPGPRHGPRIGDLAVQTSSYGTAIPKVFGTMRVAGNIVWSTDLQESSQTEGAKGQPDTITYSYSVSMAVALSSRPIRSVGRIWADGNLIRTADGAFTVGTDFRLYDGSEEQQADPLIASLEGLDSTPAYRGLALAVFDGLQLADFGNRIPFLTFEVIADEEPVPVAAMLSEVSGGAIACALTTRLQGYAAYGSTIRRAVEPVVEGLGIALFDDGTRLSSEPQTITVDEAEFGCSADGQMAPRLERSQLRSDSLPAIINLAYYDPARDYQSGIASASLDDGRRTVERLELPAALPVSTAKGLAETTLARRWAERDRLILRLPHAHLAVRPGALVQMPTEAGTWRAESVTIDSGVTALHLRRVYQAIEGLPADPGRVLDSSVTPPQPTKIVLAELPDDGTGECNSPVVAVAASANSKWRPVPLQVDTGSAVVSIQSAEAPTIIGTASTVLAPGQSMLLDLCNSLDVQLEDPEGWLESRDDEALAGGANLALLGSELLQFGVALPLGGGAFRLGRLLRGRRGSEWAMDGHSIGDDFVMLDRSRLQLLPLTTAQIGALVRVTPGGLADGSALPTELVVQGEALRPPSPVHLQASFDAAGNLNCSWTRRSKLGWEWLDGVDAPLGCSTEAYRVTVRSDEASVEITVDSEEAQFSAIQLADLGSTGLELVVVQVGDRALSRPAILPVTLS